MCTVLGEVGVSEGNFIRIMTNSRMHAPNSSATIDGHEQETHEPGVCHCCLGMPHAAAGCCLSCYGGRGYGTGGILRRSAGRGGKTLGSRARKGAAKFSWSAFSSLAIAVNAFVILASTSARADVEHSTATAESVRFAELVKTGDRARLAFRKNDALKAYNDALDIRQDPAVHGRLGLLLRETGDHALAAEKLLIAITKGQAPPYLMKQFHDAFARVRPKVCFVEVVVSEPDAAFFIDGDQESESESNGFHVFVTAGSHTFLAKLDGFEDTTATIDAPAGGELKVKLDMKALPPSPASPPAYVAPATNSGWGPDPTPDPKPVVPVKPHGSLSDSYLHFSLGAGPVLVLGATPSAAVGPQMNLGLRRGFFSLNLDARVAWAGGTVENVPDMRFMTWATGLRPCAHYKFLFGCVLLQASGMKSLSEDDRWQTRFGGGLHGGVDLVLRAPVHLQIWGDGVVPSKSFTVAKNGRGLWMGPPVLGGFGATVLLTW